MSKTGFVIGTPRSGSTLLARVIDSHPDARCLSEPDLRLRREGSYSAGRDKAVTETPMSYLSKKRDGRLHCFKETFRVSQMENSYRNVLSVDAYCEHADRALAIIRDPRAVWNSARDRWGDEPHITKELYARLWSVFVEFVQHRRLPFVRYEDLVEGATEDVYQPLGLTPMTCTELKSCDANSDFCGDERARDCDRILKDSKDRWKDSLPVEDVEYVERVCGRLMKSYGYSVQN